MLTPTDEMEAEGAMDEGAIELPDGGTEPPECDEPREGAKKTFDNEAAGS